MKYYIISASSYLNNPKIPGFLIAEMSYGEIVVPLWKNRNLENFDGYFSKRSDATSEIISTIPFGQFYLEHLS